MHKLHELKEKLIEELENFSGKQRLSRDDVEAVKYLSSAIDHLCNIVEESGMSNSSYDSSYDSSYSRSRSNDGSSYYSSRRRDSMGRYSRAEEDFKKGLQELIKESPNDQMRQKMQNLLNEM